jgi:hypothetical protein
VLYFCDALLERLAQDLEDIAAERGPCIREAHAVVGHRHLARQRHVALAIRPTGEVLCEGATGPGGDDGPMGRGADTPPGANRSEPRSESSVFYGARGAGMGLSPDLWRGRIAPLTRAAEAVNTG